LNQPADQQNTNASYGPLADNGGPTFTHALPADSAAVDAGAEFCRDITGGVELTVDQRGAPRPFDGDGNGVARCDVGAFEYGPVVSVVASDPSASEEPVTTGTFTFTRSGPTTGALTVNFTVGGTASDGTDYASIGGSVTIPAGASSVTVTVTPVADGLVEGAETVVVTLGSGGYAIGSPDEATVTITDAGVEPPPPSDSLIRLSGTGRTQTAIDISQDSFGDDGAGAVVLTRDDLYPDALAGTPFAIAIDAPILLTTPASLNADTAAEIERVLADGATVYLLGGEVALSAGVEASVAAMGFVTDRIFGPTRIETAVAIAGRLGDPDTVLITTGYNFPDALGAGPAAASVDGAVVLTTSEVPHPAVDAYLAANPSTRFAVGGPAARAYPAAIGVFGPSREETAVAVAEEFFTAPGFVGFARRDDFPDALTGGAHIGRLGGPMLLTDPAFLHPAPEAYVCANEASIHTVFVYGGTAALADAVADDIAERAAGIGCA